MKKGSLAIFLPNHETDPKKFTIHSEAIAAYYFQWITQIDGRACAKYELTLKGDEYPKIEEINVAHPVYRQKLQKVLTTIS